MKNNLKVIGVAGHPGAGKDAFAEVLVNMLKSRGVKAGFVSGGDLIRGYVTDNNLGDITDRSLLNKVSAELRAKEGPDFLNHLAVEYAIKHELAVLVIPGIRHTAEVKHVHSNEGVMLAIDIPAELRYERIKQRQSDRDAEIDFETFIKQEQAERQGSSHQVDDVIKLANAYIVNDAELAHLERVADKIWHDLESGKVHHQLTEPLTYRASEH